MADEYREDIQAAVDRLDGVAKRFGRKELRKLPEVLWEDERVEAIVQGSYDNKQGIVALTDRRLVFVEEGLMRSRVEDFPLDKISSIQHSTGMMFGKLTIYASGNKAEISQVAPKNYVATFAETVRNRLNAPKPTGGESAAAVADPMDQLKKLGELRDAGVLSEEEFEAKKQDLLKRL